MSKPPDTDAAFSRLIGVEAYDPPRYSHEPETLDELLALPPEQLAGVDIARMNLLCATGLPGAEDLDVEAALARLDDWAQKTHRYTNNALSDFRSRPGEFQNSESKFRMLMVLSVLQQDFGVHYQEDGLDVNYSSARYPTIAGMMTGTAGGNCASMPVMYVAVGRRLGYPLSLMLGKTHIFARWDGTLDTGSAAEVAAYRERFNVEGTNPMLSTHPDEYYRKWPYPISDAEAAGGWYLKPLTSAEELAVFMSIRGYVLMENRRFGEAALAFTRSYRLAPHNPMGRECIEFAHAMSQQKSARLIAAAHGRSLPPGLESLTPSQTPGRFGGVPADPRINPLHAARLRAEQAMVAAQQRTERESLGLPDLYAPTMPTPPRPGAYRPPIPGQQQSPHQPLPSSIPPPTQPLYSPPGHTQPAQYPY